MYNIPANMFAKTTTARAFQYRNTSCFETSGWFNASEGFVAHGKFNLFKLVSINAMAGVGKPVFEQASDLSFLLWEIISRQIFSYKLGDRE